MWRFVRDNPKAVIFAVLVHVIFAAVLIITLDGKKPTPAINQNVNIVKAKVIDEAKIKKERKRKEDIKRKKLAEQKKRQEKKRKAELKKKRDLEQKKKLALKKKKAAAAKKKKLTEEKKRKAEQQKKIEEQERKQRIAELQRQLEADEAERKKQQQLKVKRAAQQKEVDRYRALIKQSISNKWRVPVSAKKGQECILKLKLIPSGEVISVEVVKSSGDTIYDRSVEAAVFKAQPLPLPPAESGLFNEFREINVPFRLESRNL